MKQQKEKIPPLYEALVRVMSSIDNQVAREMQRSPEEESKHGVQKWEPIQKRIEDITAFILNSLGDRTVDLDSLLVLSQAFTKSLYLFAEDMGPEGLGKIRQSYCITTGENIASDASKVVKALRGEIEAN